MSDPKTSKNIMLLGFVSLLNDISSEIIQPILPIFITSLGGGSLALGLIGGVSDGLPSILQVFAGYWSDCMGKRKPLIIAGYGLSALGKLFLSISTTWQQVFVLKILERTGKGVRSAPRDALISESADKSLRGRGFGLHRAMDSAGAVVGSILAYLLWQSGLSYSSIFTVAAVLAIAALIPFKLVREQKRSPSCQVKLSISGLSPDLGKFLVIASLFSLGQLQLHVLHLARPDTLQRHECGGCASASIRSFQFCLCGPLHAHGDLVGQNREKECPDPGICRLCTYGPWVCLCLLFDRAYNSLRSLRAGLCHNRCLAECLCLRSQSRKSEKHISRALLHGHGNGCHPLPALWPEGSGQ